MSASQNSATVAAPAKINLSLAVLGRRADGFHELLTVLAEVDLVDDLTVALRARRAEVPAGHPDVHLVRRVEAPFRGELPEPAHDLIVRAAVALLQHVGAAGEVGLELTLVKRIPAAGGLGGGSSDAAAVLRTLDGLLGSPAGAAELHLLAAQLGSDVPFFLTGGTALCSGRGEIVEPIEPSPSFSATLMIPEFGLSTPAVYSALAAPPLRNPPTRQERDALASRFAGADATALESLFRNDLSGPATRLDARLARMLAGDGVHLSGSGSTLFAFGDEVPSDLRAGDMPPIACVRCRSRTR